MWAKILCAVLMVVATAASGQTIYRTVTGNGKIVYSEDPVAETPGKPSQVKTYSSAELGETNTLRAVGGSGEGGSGGNAACQADARKYCAQSGGGKARFECLLDHQQDVSDACYESLKKQMSSRQNEPQGQSGSGGAPPAMQACKQDSQQYCRGVQPGQGRIINCLLDHQNDISDACYQALAEQKQ